MLPTRLQEFELTVTGLLHCNTQVYATHEVTNFELTVTGLLHCNTQVYATHEVTRI